MSDGYEIPSDCAQLDDCGVKQLIYLDFDGERTVYRNQDLGIVLDVEIENSGMTEKQKRYILKFGIMLQQHQRKNLKHIDSIGGIFVL